MPREVSKDPENVADVVWGAIWAGLGSVVAVGLFIGSFYLFEPTLRPMIVLYLPYFLIGVGVLFLAGFGMSLQFVLEMQFWRGKWK